MPTQTTINFTDFYNNEDSISIQTLTSCNKIIFDEQLQGIITNFTEMGESNCRHQIIELLNSYFGRLSILLDNGLRMHFNNLKQEVIEKNLIGMILYGMNVDYTLINSYTDVRRNDIKLTIHGICRVLVKDYFTLDEFNECCSKLNN